MWPSSGENVFYIPLRGDISDQRKAKINLEPRFIHGVFLGLTDRSDELIVWGPEGLRKARTIRRRPEEERFSEEAVLAVRGTPLQPNPGEGDTRIRTRMEPGIAVPEVIGDPVTKEDIREEMGEQIPFYLTRASVIGYTKGCPGCRATELNFKTTSHSRV